MMLIDWKVLWLSISLLSFINFSILFFFWYVSTFQFDVILFHFSSSVFANPDINQCSPAQHILKQGGLYELSVFGATRSNPNFWFGDAHVSIRFTDQTVFVELSESIHPIPRRAFCFAITTNSCSWLSRSQFFEVCFHLAAFVQLYIIIVNSTQNYHDECSANIIKGIIDDIFYKICI